jgi:hypothetical protein
MRNPLRRSKYRRGGAQKSCPECSAQAGKLVFKALSKFGQREMDGEVHIQSWCLVCRHEARE